jgi:hypothetical protein
MSKLTPAGLQPRFDKEKIMVHLTYKQVQDIADGMVDKESRDMLRHAAECRRCAREVAIQRSLARAAKEAPVVKTSPQFTRRVMRNIVPGESETWLFRLLGGTGKFFAMIVVLGSIGTALVLLPSSVGSSPEESTLGKLFSDYYGKMAQVLVQGSGQASQAVASQTSGDSAKILVITLASILVLVMVDRFFFKAFLRSRIKPSIR